MEEITNVSEGVSTVSEDVVAVVDPVANLPETMTVRDLLRGIRVNKTLSQKALAELTGFTVVYVSMVEKGKRQASSDYIEKVSLAMGVSKDAVLFATIEPPTELNEKELKQFKAMQTRLLSTLCYPDSMALPVFTQ